METGEDLFPICYCDCTRAGDWIGIGIGMVNDRLSFAHTTRQNNGKLYIVSQTNGHV